MTNRRLFSHALLSALFILLATALIWQGCSSDRGEVAPPSTQITQPAGNSNAAPDQAFSEQAHESAILRVMEIQNRNTDAIMNTAGVVGVGTGLDANGNPVIKVFTADAAASGRLASQIEGVAVEVEETGEFTAQALTGRYRPVPIGVSVGNNRECAAGTIGCVIYKGTTPYILSNNHVLAMENDGNAGDPIVQPGRYDNPRCANRVTNDKIAELSQFYPITFSTSANNTMDAAIAVLTTTQFQCNTPSSYYGFPGTSIVSPSLSLAVKKLGRTSSLTTGTITAVNVTVNVGYLSGTARFTGQFVTSRGMSKSGDSGSLVVTNNANNSPVGLLFAGTSRGEAICTPIGVVLNYFNATICTQ